MKGHEVSILKIGSKIHNENFEEIIIKHEEDLEYKSSIKRLRGVQVNYKNESGNYRIEGAYPEFQFIEKAYLLQGRFINLLDNENYEKVAVIGKKVKEEIFKSEDPMNKQLQINGINFKVVGVYSDPGGEREETSF